LVKIKGELEEDEEEEEGKHKEVQEEQINKEKG